MTAMPEKTAADPQTIIAELQRKFDELTAQQAATADILKVIASSPGDVQPVFHAIATNANRLIGGFSTTVTRVVGDELQLAAFTSTHPAADEALKAYFPLRFADLTTLKRLNHGEVTQTNDTEKDAPPLIRELGRLRGFRSQLAIALFDKGTTIGTISVTRKEPGGFSENEVQLIKIFADQAVIAIQNSRLFNETKEALAHQTATSEVLQVISGSMADAQPVFERIIDSIERLFDFKTTAIFLAPGDGLLHVAARRGIDVELLDALYPMPMEQTAGRHVIHERRQIYFHDVINGENVPISLRRVGEAMGNFSGVITPMFWRAQSVGTIAVTREPNAAFSAKELNLLQTFADQAVIAIQNARLFNETGEALERQTATAEILEVIARSPSDVQPVFDAIVRSSNRLIAGFSTAVLRVIDDSVHLSAFTPIDKAGDESLKAFFPRRIADSPNVRAALNGEVVQVADTEADTMQVRREISRSRGFRSNLLVPLMSNGAAIGVISVTRTEPGMFAANHIQLLQTFANQAVIAIENVRLFNETQEALERQTATADILKVIASSPSDVQPVFEAIAISANRLLGGFSTAVFRFVDGITQLAAFTPTDPAADEILRASFPRSVTRFQPFELARKGEAVQIADTETSSSLGTRDIARARGFRRMLFLPLMSKGDPIGLISVTRAEPGSFAAHHVQLLQTFADQAVIAIENVRLFNEVQAKTRDLTESLEQQTATSEVLEVISSSPGELQPVFQKMLENATKVCGANFGVMNLWDGESFNIAAGYNIPPAFAAVRSNMPMRPYSGSGLAIVVETRRFVHVHDVRKSPGYLAGVPNVLEIANVAGARTLVIVPMLREDELIGIITIYRQEVKPFTDKQIALLESFTKQAVIAIENTRLLKELRQRTDDLTRSLDDLRAAQDRLVQTEKLASLGQLTAGIAHEIKNPLNFVNNFSALSVELTDELEDIMKQAQLAGKLRTEVDELTGLLKSNLKKVVQHGKRADSIVKNMLLHSREGSGEQRSVDINALLDESLNLAYHGARAEKSGFNITLQQDFDASAGSAELFPQEITRALLNLISNGFYAATKRVSEGEVGFEPILLATTKGLGNSVEIRIRDNGAGIPAGIKEKIFNPFFTTKPAGEGTGLGLSMTHDIIVKQHGGRIDVETELGVFTEFVITLPRESVIPPSRRSE